MAAWKLFRTSLYRVKREVNFRLLFRARAVYSSMKIEIQNEGTIVLLRPLDMEAEDWFDANLDPDRQSFGKTVAVESRYAANIVEGFLADGGEIEQ